MIVQVQGRSANALGQECEIGPFSKENDGCVGKLHSGCTATGLRETRDGGGNHLLYEYFAWS